ncbi:hypothetical protein Ddye_023670 [Dipteronia dyeriana]|uniref:DUF1985 domain-containing protein n=1 Tax=Dipteronia dyeriana TaxID=168575 RepID=A0AAD9TTV8_9ROSI|nr:hypothetical protein Ddye_023670 [Dipteronia dyeriana]
MAFFDGIVHRLLLHELHHDGPNDEMRFMLGLSVRISRVEFCLINGLKFGAITDMKLYEDGPEWKTPYFDGRGAVTLLNLKQGFNRVNGKSNSRQWSFVSCYIVNCVLIRAKERNSVHIWHLHLIDNLDMFNVFRWGSYVNKYSIFGFKRAILSRSTRYNIFGLA